MKSPYDIPSKYILGGAHHIIGKALLSLFPQKCGELVRNTYNRMTDVDLTIARFIYIYLGESALVFFLEEEEQFLYNRDAYLGVWASQFVEEEVQLIDHDMEYVKKKKEEEDREEFSRLCKGELSAIEKSKILEKHGGNFKRFESRFMEENYRKWEEEEYRNWQNGGTEEEDDDLEWEPSDEGIEALYGRHDY